MSKELRGLPAADALTEELIKKCGDLKERGIIPCLAILRIGEREDDISYETGAIKRCEKIGIDVRRINLPADADKKSVLEEIRKINEDDSIHGCLMFRPLPDKDTENAACSALDPKKDVDCMTAGSLASVFTGKGDGYPPCTAKAVMEILKYYGYDLTGKRVTVIGRSLVIGKPVSMMLQQENATVTMCHTKTKDLADTCKNAEILVVAAGRGKVVDETYVSPGQVVIDVGINVDENGHICGDVDYEKVEPIVSAITPVPRGVGSVTTAVLASHVIEAAEKR